MKVDKLVEGYRALSAREQNLFRQKTNLVAGQQGTNPRQSPLTICKRLGFKQIHDVSGRYTVADLMPVSKGRTGLYLLGFADGNFYIGQSVDAAKRFGQHCLRHPDIDLFSYQKVPKRKLDEKEEETIWKAEKLGIPLTNKVFVSRTAGETDLDVVLPPKDQERWLKKPTLFRRERKRVHIENEEAHRRRFNRNFKELSESPRFMKTLPLLKKYIQETLPAYKRTEYSFWSLSCAPSTNKSAWPRIAAFNIARMETFVVGYIKKHPEYYWGFINISNEKMVEEYGKNWMKEIQEFYGSLEYGGVEADETDYASAGQDQASIHFSSLGACIDLFANRGILDAARRFNLNAMRRRPCFYRGFHCFQLVDLVLKRGNKK